MANITLALTDFACGPN